MVTYNIINDLLIERRLDESSTHRTSNTQLYILIHKNTTMLITSKYVLHANVQSMCQLFIKKYSSKGDRMKRVMMEYKLLFGPLIKTKSQKKSRLKLQKERKIPSLSQGDEKPNKIIQNVNTELQWIMKTSSKNLKKITAKPREKQSNNKDQSSVKEFNEMEFESSTDQNTKNHLHSDSNQTAQEIGIKFNTTFNSSAECSDSEVTLSNSNVSDQNTKYTSSNFGRLSDIVIKNLPSFPIMGSKQEFPTQSMEILSISGRDNPKTIKFPSITKILSQTMSPESKLALEAWKERMINNLGQEGFEMHQKGIG